MSYDTPGNSEPLIQKS